MSKDRSGKKALLLRIGVEYTGTQDEVYSEFEDTYPCGGFYGPFWESNRLFEYFPIPESEWKQNRKGEYKAIRYLRSEESQNTYGKAPGNRLEDQLFETMNEVIPRRREKLRTVVIHHDPNFTECTYGDGHGSIDTPFCKGQLCANLKTGDLLVFCEPLRNCEKEDDHGLFIIGYFTVKKPHDFEKSMDIKERKQILDDYWNKNAHLCASWADAYGWKEEELRNAYLHKPDNEEWEDDLVLVTGWKHKSGLLKKAIRITRKPFIKASQKESFYVRGDLVKRLALDNPDFGRGYKTVNWNNDDEESIRNLIALLNEGEGFHRRAHSL